MYYIPRLAINIPHLLLPTNFNPRKFKRSYTEKFTTIARHQISYKIIYRQLQSLRPWYDTIVIVDIYNTYLDGDTHGIYHHISYYIKINTVSDLV
jgi:hypothetical protein